ncbi:hypothetical protein RI367_002180 [Sorochytrium milnesiophthora]
MQLELTANWETMVKEIVYIHPSEQPRKYHVGVLFNDGTVGEFERDVVVEKCLQKLLDFFEAHTILKQAKA